MTRFSAMRNNNLYFCDTTIIYYRVLGQSPLIRELAKLSGERPLYISAFTRGEFIRGYIAGLICLYCAIQEENDVDRGLEAFTDEMRNRPRRLADALRSTTQWLNLHEESSSVPAQLRRLGDFIQRCLRRLDEEFPNRYRDPLMCDIGVLSFPPEPYHGDQILDFYQTLLTLDDSPECRQCEFRESQQIELTDNGIDLFSKAQQELHSNYTGYVKQAEWIEKAVRSRKTRPTCWYCERLGDTIIALSSPPGAVILTGDRHSFPAFGDILGKDVYVMESPGEIQRRRTDTRKKRRRK